MSNVFLASSFDKLFDGRIGTPCVGLGCIFRESAYRTAFSIALSPPREYAGYEATKGEPVDFCASGKAMVGDTCQPVIENTIDLRYDLKFELNIVESMIERNMTLLTLMKSVQQQIIGPIRFSISDGVHFTSVAVSGVWSVREQTNYH